MSPSHAEMILLAILTVATYSLVGLLAIWAGLGRPHWFLRVAVVGGILLLLLLIPAYEPLLVFSIQSVVVILPLMLLRAFRAPVPAAGPDGKSQTGVTARFRAQFSLSDLLLLTVVVAVAVAVAVRVPPDAWKFWEFVRDYVQGRFDSLSPWLGGPITPARGWTAFFLSGVALGIFSLVAAWVGLGRRRLWLRLVVLCVLPTSAVMAAWLALMRASGWLVRGTRRMASSMATGPPAATMRPSIRRLAKLAAVLLSLLVLLPPAGTFCVLVAPPPKLPQIVLPDPNGYDDLMKAADSLKGAAEPNLDIATNQQLRAWVVTCRPVLETARTGLDRRCMVPVEFSTPSFEFVLPRVQGLRQLTRALIAEGRLAELEDRSADAVRSYLDIIRLGQAGSRRGLAIDFLVGHAVEDIGVEALNDLRETLTPEQCHELIDSLQTLMVNREPPEDVWARYQLWRDVALDWKWRLTHRLSMIAGSERDSRPFLQKSDMRVQAEFRLLISGLALRSYSVKNGNPPEKLADLVPDYLPAVPQDPYSGKLLVYRREAAKYVLYSVGPDGQDDGGQPWDRVNWSGGDFLLDEPPQAP